MNHYMMAYEEATGKICGFYIEKMHSNIPTPNVTITEEQHSYCMTHNGWVKWDAANQTLVDIPLPAIKKQITLQKRVELLEGAMDELLMGGLPNG